MNSNFHIHGDNIVECKRAFEYIISGLGDLIVEVKGPNLSVTCPSYTVILENREFNFQFLPGYGERRWNQDILAFIQRSGGRLREAADAIVTRIEKGEEKAVAAIEFCGALPAGNQAWQRQGRAFSFAHAKVPYFYVAELGGFELTADRDRKAERMPNPAIPFSFIAMTKYHGSICLPVYEANPGATNDTIKKFSRVFGKADFLEIIKCLINDESPQRSSSSLSEKCLSLVMLLASSKKRKDGLSAVQWENAHESLINGEDLPDFLLREAPLNWKKTAYIEALTNKAKMFMALGAVKSFGITSISLPLSIVSKESRLDFCSSAKKLYPDLSKEFEDWLGNTERHLAIAWVMGFKPRGDDARPDRGLPPLARMLIGDNCDLMTFVYGPAPSIHWDELSKKPVSLAERNGLWESVLAVSDAIIVDSTTKSTSTPRGYLRKSWAEAFRSKNIPLYVEAKVKRFGEQDVDTALHVAFASLGSNVVFEGMCNPPGGDWSGISFRWESAGQEYRWLTLPRVSADGAKRPDHVFAVFLENNETICLCIESKENASALDCNIGPRLSLYTESLFEIAPSIYRREKNSAWKIYHGEWNRRNIIFVSAGAYLASPSNPFNGVQHDTNIDMQIGVELFDEGRNCILHVRGDTDIGKKLAKHLHSLSNWGKFVKINLIRAKA